MVALRGHIQHRSIQAKSVQVNKVQRIVLGLQSTLDFERGGEIARNLDELYRYVIRRLVHVHAHNDVEALDEVTGLMREIRDAWRTLLPDALQAPIIVTFHMPSDPRFHAGMRQLVHVAFKLAAKRGAAYTDLLKAHREVVGRSVTDNLFRRHLRPLFVG